MSKWLAERFCIGQTMLRIVQDVFFNYCKASPSFSPLSDLGQVVGAKGRWQLLLIYLEVVPIGRFFMSLHRHISYT